MTLLLLIGGQCICHHQWKQWKYWHEILRLFGSKSLVQNGFLSPPIYLTDIFDITETNTASMPACWGLALMRTKMKKTWLRLPWCWRQERKSSGLTSTPSLTFFLTLLEGHPMRDTNATRWVRVIHQNNLYSTYIARTGKVFNWLFSSWLAGELCLFVKSMWWHRLVIYWVQIKF